jgi:general secretion pathway protein N
VKRAWPLLVTGALAYLLVLVVTFPAARLMPLLERQVAGLSLHAVAGSVFSGQAGRLVYQGLDFGKLTWEFRPAALLLGRMAYHLKLVGAAAPGHADIAFSPWGHVYGRDIELLLSPDLLVEHYSPVPVQTSGTLRLQIDAFRMAGEFPDEVAGLISWEDGVILDPVEIILGDVSMTLNSREDALLGRLVEGGRLEAAGEVQLFADGRYQLDLQILPNNEMSDETLAVLETLGQVLPDSRLLFKTTGRL